MANEDLLSKSYVQEKWNELTATFEKNIQDKWWNIIQSRYSEPSRKYHTFSHLQALFKQMESYIDEIHSKQAFSYAIFFHDLAYDAQSQENEEESYKLFNEFATESTLIEDKDLVSKVEELIMASKAHCTEEHKTEGMFGKDDVHYFLDIDISILGSEASEYKKYTEQICEEFSFMPKKKYNFLRLKVLQMFLQIPNIYATQAFREKYEKQARSNIQDEIEWLKTEES